jgi:hypothetical protein
MIRGKPVVIQVIDKITNAVNKTKMMMAIFELHRKYFEDVDFDTLFLDILDRLIPYPSLLYNTSYLEISAEIINDEDITDYKLQKILLNWIYNEPFFKTQIIMETPEAEIELPPPIVDIIVQQM